MSFFAVCLFLKTAYGGYVNSEAGFQSGPGDTADADEMPPWLLVTKSSPPSSGGSENKRAEFFIISLLPSSIPEPNTKVFGPPCSLMVPVGWCDLIQTKLQIQKLNTDRSKTMTRAKRT